MRSLDAEADQFANDGACVIRSAVEDSQLTEIANAIDAFASEELADLSAMAASTDKARFRGGIDHWRTNPVLKKAATSGVIPTLVAQILSSDRLWLYEDSVLIKEPGSTTETKWHTDDGYFHVRGPKMATVWLALDDSPAEAGSLRFVRGSHQSESEYRPNMFVSSEPIPGTVGTEAPQLELNHSSTFGWDLLAGDMTIHQSRTLHAAGGNSGLTSRRALSIRYCGDGSVIAIKPGAPLKDGFAQELDGEKLQDIADELGLPGATL